MSRETLAYGAGMLRLDTHGSDAADLDAQIKARSDSYMLMS